MLDVRLIVLRAFGHVSRINPIPTVLVEKRRVFRISRMDIESKLEGAVGTARELGEFPKLVDAQTICLTLEFDWTEIAAPASDGCDRPVIVDWLIRPEIENDRLGRRDPVETAGRDLTIKPTDIQTDGHEGVVVRKQIV